MRFWGVPEEQGDMPTPRAKPYRQLKPTNSQVPWNPWGIWGIVYYQIQKGLMYNPPPIGRNYPPHFLLCHNIPPRKKKSSQF